ncbi:hypothetical protein GSI_05578 [Ganoderma sinense ZZ0214-1]|uniref:DUF6534 domain-containing protein n=1 Tax=Ganoderma sinense ZZ0214-1 TaxID=1077348 RepID=A0A2G8SEY5_9APHY|nr:hypothetical protein GSI_05578 [Ganoderma sinense ZZ0214-1]
MAPLADNTQLHARSGFPLPIIGSVESAFGLVLIGSYASLALYGLFINQTYKYFRMYKAEAPWLKGIVITAIVLETAVTVLHVHLAYYYFVKNYGNPLVFLRGVWSLDIFPVVATCIMINCQSFYTVRILLVGPSKYRLWLVVAIIILMGGALGVSVASTIVGFQGITLNNFSKLLVSLDPWLSAFADVILTATLIYILHHSRTGFKSTDSMINSLILYTISTGLLTTIFNIISFVLVHVYGVKNWVWLGTMMIAERLYSNSLMAALNSRKVTSKKRADADSARPAEVYGTAVRASTLRFNNSSAINEGIELPQVDSDSGVMETTRSVGDVKVHPFPFGDVSA